MKTLRTIVSGVFFAVCGALLLATSPVQAAKPGGGGSGDTTCTGLTAAQFPAYIHSVTTVQGGIASTRINLADAKGKCIRTLASVAGSGERDTLLMDLGGGVWRAVWTDGDGTDYATYGVVVRDFTVASGAVIIAGSGARSATGYVASLEALPGGAFLYITNVPGQSTVPAQLWQADVQPDGSGSPVVVRTQLSTIGAPCNSFDLAVGPDSDSLYLLATTESTGGTRLNTIKQFSLADPDLGAKVSSCDGIDALQVDSGNSLQFAVGRCGSALTCLALERFNVKGIPCTPDYYRTDVFILGTGVTTVLQLAYPSWDSSGVLYGRLTGSSSKNSCTAKIYEQIVKQTISASATSLTAAPAETLSSGRTLDVPNSF